MTDYTPQELMVVAAAREIRDGEVVFVGMRLPLIAFGIGSISEKRSSRVYASAGASHLLPVAGPL